MLRQIITLSSGLSTLELVSWTIDLCFFSLFLARTSNCQTRALAVESSRRLGVGDGYSSFSSSVSSTKWKDCWSDRGWEAEEKKLRSIIGITASGSVVIAFTSPLGLAMCCLEGEPEPELTAAACILGYCHGRCCHRWLDNFAQQTSYENARGEEYLTHLETMALLRD
ncbi:hypothetical protein Tco_0488649 [Tanacetum coccineum]